MLDGVVYSFRCFYNLSTACHTPPWIGLFHLSMADEGEYDGVYKHPFSTVSTVLLYRPSEVLWGFLKYRLMVDHVAELNSASRFSHVRRSFAPKVFSFKSFLASVISFLKTGNVDAREHW